MAGHVTYACNCLNVKIHLANKYYLEGHEKFRNGKFTRLEEPPITGWKFELSMDGVKVEYANLIRLRIIMDNPEGWITISCHNCSTGDVYSVKRPNTKINYPFNDSILSKFGDQVIIHKGTVFGSEIEKLQKKATYSSTFHVILNPDLPIDHVSQENEDTLNPELKNQHKQVQQLLKQSLIDLEEITEKKIQAFQKEQEILLVREKEKATYDSAILWQRMKEIAKTVQEEEHRVRRLDYHKTKNGVTDQILFNRIISDEDQDQPIHDTSLDDTEKEMRKGESHVHFSHDYSFEPETDQRRRSSAFKRDLFGGFTCPSHGNRRSSYVLDESAIANSFKKAHHLDPVSEMPQFHRRCSSLVPSSSQHHHHHHNLHPLTESNNNLHPLAQPKTSTDSTAATIPTSSNTSSSWEDDEDNTNKSDDDSEEELFPLDEDIDKLNEHSLPTTSQNRRPSSVLKGKRKPSNKYVEFEEDHDEKEKEQQESRKYLMKTNQHGKQQDHNFATSVPITINHPPAFSVKNKMENMQSSVQKYPSSSFIQEPTHFNPTATGRKPSFVGFDYAEADRRASLKFPPLDDQRRSSIVTTLNHTLSSHHYHHHHHHHHHNNNNTQHLSSNKNKIELELDQDDIEPDEDGPMIPPHILAANTVTDETEALFGSVPHNSIRNRPLE